MDRRHFLQQTVMGAASLTTVAPAFGQSPLAQEPQRVSSTTLAVGDEVVERSIDDLRRALESGQLTARTPDAGVPASHRRRRSSGRGLNSIIELNPDALDIAERLDTERKAGRVRGPLHGIPVLIKDNIDTADRMKTTAGSLAMLEAHPLLDAGIVTRLREAGAVLLGKTNLSEWANFRSDNSTSGWSGRGGLTRNPVCARSQRVRIEQRLWSGRRGEPVRRRRRDRDRWIDHLSLVTCRPGRHQADRRARQPQRHHPDLGNAGHCRADGADGRRRRGAAAGAGRTRPA